jgi:hypothetical protein
VKRTVELQLQSSMKDEIAERICFIRRILSFRNQLLEKNNRTEEHICKKKNKNGKILAFCTHLDSKRF